MGEIIQETIRWPPGDLSRKTARRKWGSAMKLQEIYSHFLKMGLTLGTHNFSPDENITLVSEAFPGRPGSLSYIKHSPDAECTTTSNSSVVLLPLNASQENARWIPHYIEVSNPRLAYAVAAQMLQADGDIVGAPHTEIAESAEISEGTHLLGSVAIGNRTIIGPGVVIGREGFGFERIGLRETVRLPHIGSVSIGNDVEIGANCSIDRGTFGPTSIGDFTKLDNHVNISHNAKIGKGCLIAAGARIAGSTIVGDGVWIGPNAVVGNGLEIGEGAEIAIGSVVVKDVAAGSRVFGNPAKIFE